MSTSSSSTSEPPSTRIELPNGEVLNSWNLAAATRASILAMLQSEGSLEKAAVRLGITVGRLRRYIRELRLTWGAGR